MAHWLDQYPALRVMHKQIAAADYNCVRLRMLHQRLPWSIALKRFRCLYFVLEESAWVCLDECQNSLPILAWTNFDTKRNALVTPVDCELRLYHRNAGLVMGAALDALVEALNELPDARKKIIYPTIST